MMNEIDKYIASFPEEIQQRLNQVREVIRQSGPDATEIISYMMPTYYLNGNLVHFAAFKNHIGLYPAPSGIEAFKKELSAYKGAKGSVQFPHDQPLPLDLIAEIVRFRVMENSAKKKNKKAIIS
jgi:uncharacterized protein YdhG (YjbR/CyaY superfamily)